LREQNLERVGDDGLADGLRDKHHLSLGERLEHERREVSIFSEQQQVLYRKGGKKREELQ
jgi:hypothetical protein